MNCCIHLNRSINRLCITVNTLNRTFKTKRKVLTFHAAYRKPESSNIDFNTLGLKYPPTIKSEFIINKTKWTPPPKKLPSLPFVVERTMLGSSLPVYTDYKGGNTKVITMLRKCSGDIELLKSEMEKVTGKTVTIKPGKLIVDGNYTGRLKMWLIGLGF